LRAFFTSDSFLTVDRRHDAAQRALLAHDARQAARVDAFDRDDLLLREVLGQSSARAEVARDRAHLADHERFGPRASALGVLVGDAVVADERVRHDHDLSRVRRIGEDLVVPGHRRVEHEISARLARRAGGEALEHEAVLEGQPRFRCAHRFFVSARSLISAAMYPAQNRCRC
jgi:hypothetical protein